MFTIQVYTTDESPRQRDGWLARLLRRRSPAETADSSREGLAPNRFLDSPTAETEPGRP